MFYESREANAGMKKLSLTACMLFCAHFCCAEPVPADDILAFVRSKLPDAPLTLTGSLKVRTPNGFTKANLPVEINLHWGAQTPSARYRIGEETLLITWNGNAPEYDFSNERNQPTSDIRGTGISWADLSFSVLWWPEAKLVDEEKKINRDCYVVEVPVPESENTMRLWIEKKMGMLLEAQTLNVSMEPVRRMKIKSIKKMDGLWIAKDLEIRDYTTGNRTTLQISDLKWQEPQVPQ
jgi:hypothetical protein